MQRIFQHVGFQAHGSENVFHIPSLLTHSMETPVIHEIKPEKNIHQQLLQLGLELAPIPIYSHAKVTFHLNHAQSISHESTCAIRFSFPVIAEKEILIVLRAAKKEHSNFTGYLSIIG